MDPDRPGHQSTMSPTLITVPMISRGTQAMLVRAVSKMLALFSPKLLVLDHGVNGHVFC